VIQETLRALRVLVEIDGEGTLEILALEDRKDDTLMMTFV